jgi:hypothetical protein
MTDDLNQAGKSFTLSWRERKEYLEVVNPPWWRFWAKPQTRQRSLWTSHYRTISSDLADYIMAGGSEANSALRAAELIRSMCCTKEPDYLQLKGGMHYDPTPYIATTGSTKAFQENQ